MINRLFSGCQSLVFNNYISTKIQPNIINIWPGSKSEPQIPYQNQNLTKSPNHKITKSPNHYIAKSPKNKSPTLKYRLNVASVFAQMGVVIIICLTVHLLLALYSLIFVYNLFQRPITFQKLSIVNLIWSSIFCFKSVKFAIKILEIFPGSTHGPLALSTVLQVLNSVAAASAFSSKPRLVNWPLVKHAGKTSLRFNSRIGKISKIEGLFFIWFMDWRKR